MNRVQNFLANEGRWSYEQIEKIAVKSPNLARFVLPIPVALRIIVRVLIVNPINCIDEISQIPQGKIHLLKASGYLVTSALSPLIALVAAVIDIGKLILNPIEFAQKGLRLYDKNLVNLRLDQFCEQEKFTDPAIKEELSRVAKNQIFEIENLERCKVISFEEANQQIRNILISPASVEELKKRAETENNVAKGQKEVENRLAAMKNDIAREEAELKLDRPDQDIFRTEIASFQTAFIEEKNFPDHFSKECVKHTLRKNENKAFKNKTYREKVRASMKDGSLKQKLIDEISLKKESYNLALETHKKDFEPLRQAFAEKYKVFYAEQEVKLAEFDASNVIKNTELKQSIFFAPYRLELMEDQFKAFADLNEQYRNYNEEFTGYRSSLINASIKDVKSMRFRQPQSDEIQARIALESNQFKNKFARSCGIAILIKEMNQGENKKTAQACLSTEGFWNRMSDEVNAKNEIYLNALKVREGKGKEIAPEDKESADKLQAAFDLFLQQLRDASLEDAKKMAFQVV